MAKTIGEKIKAMRIAKKIPVAKIAEGLKVTRQTIYNIEKGIVDISAEDLLQLSRLLNCDIQTLLPKAKKQK